MLQNKKNKELAESKSYEDAFIHEHKAQSETEPELVDQLIELAGDKDKKKIETRLKEIKPVPTTGGMHALEKIVNVDKKEYISDYCKVLNTTMLSFSTD